MNRKTIVASVLFFLSVLLLTRLDFLIHETLPARHAPGFTLAWYNEYLLIYGVLFQICVIALSYWSRSWGFLVAAEAFILSSTQDLFFYGVWGGGLPPLSMQWTWVGHYDLLGYWNVATQIILSTLVNLLVVIGLFIYKQK